MYTIKQVSTLTGVGEARLRAWERRYRVVEPVRSAGGYRLYDEDQVNALREMATLVTNGVPASVAARVLTAAPGGSTGGAAGSKTAASESLIAPGTAVSESVAEAAYQPDLVAAASSLDPQLLWSVIDRGLGQAPFEQVVEQWLLPQLVLLGRAWETGRISVAQEHFASAGLMRAVSSVYDASPRSSSGAVVLVGLPPGARHELALFCFATCLRRLGGAVVYLGADIPEDAWRDAVQRRRARAAVVGVTADREVPAAQAVVDRLATVVPPLSVWVGGSHRDAVRGGRLLPDSVVEAARILHRSLAAGEI